MWFEKHYLLLIIFGFIRNASAVDNRKFPSKFLFGVATAAYQVEGAWNEEDKGESIWDNYTHSNPDVIVDKSNGDIACDTYHKPDTDTQLLQDLGVDFYRFSLSWSRILPSGQLDDDLNVYGIDYYHRLIDNLTQAGIEPFVTLYHWDLPQQLQDNLGGWTNETIIDIFTEYARFAFDLFGDKVKYWATFNEPHLICQQGYESGTKAPGIESPGVLLYYCAHNILKAHAAVYRYFNESSYKEHGAKISIVLNSDWYEPNSDSEQDLEAAERQRQFYFGWFANPIVYGNYPQVMIDRIAERSKQEAFVESRLPVFTDEEIEFIKGTYDFIGLNHYTTSLVSWVEDEPIGEPGYSKDISVAIHKNDTWESSASSWLKVVPWGMRNILKWIKDTYNDTEIIVTENGFSDTGDLNDDRRIDYHREYLSSILEAIYDDGVKVIGYTAWSFLDNFEWNRGYTEKFGLYHVDFEDPGRNRTPKASAEYFKNVTASKCLVDECQE